jgi:hypothetical protein
MPKTNEEEPQLVSEASSLQRFQAAGRLSGAAPEQLIAACLEKALPVIGIKLDVYLSVAPERPRRWTPWPGRQGSTARERP